MKKTWNVRSDDDGGLAAGRRTVGTGRMILLTGILAFALGLASALLWIRLPEPSSVASSQTELGAIAASSELFADQQDSRVDVTMTDAWEGSAPMAGVLRFSSCTVGEAVTSGTAPLTIDSTPILVLNLATPPYRDYRPGDEGSDVAALQQELIRLGYLEGEADGSYGPATAQAVNTLVKEIGGNADQTGLPLSQLIWIPAAQMTISQCPATMGQRLDVGTPVFLAGGTIAHLRITVPEAAAPGDRIAILGDVMAPVGADGTVDDPEFIAAFAAGARYKQWLEDSTTELSVPTRLADPIEAVAVPASALYNLVGSEGCVVSSGVPTAVTVLGSQFGRALVVVEGSLGDVDVAPHEGSAPCR